MLEAIGFQPKGLMGMVIYNIKIVGFLILLVQYRMMKVPIGMVTVVDVFHIVSVLFEPSDIILAAWTQLLAIIIQKRIWLMVVVRILNKVMTVMVIKYLMFQIVIPILGLVLMLEILKDFAPLWKSFFQLISL